MVLTVDDDDDEPAGVKGVVGVVAGGRGVVESSLPAGLVVGDWSPTTVVRRSMMGLLWSIIVKWN